MNANTAILAYIALVITFGDFTTDTFTIVDYLDAIYQEMRND